MILWSTFDFFCYFRAMNVLLLHLVVNWQIFTLIFVFVCVLLLKFNFECLSSSMQFKIKFCKASCGQFLDFGSLALCVVVQTFAMYVCMHRDLTVFLEFKILMLVILACLFYGKLWTKNCKHRPSLSGAADCSPVIKSTQSNMTLITVDKPHPGTSKVER